ncbi:MAG: cyclase family protein [Pirellulales bacterium]|nr:cyclase family protein [Pirellulales bacterium]
MHRYLWLSYPLALDGPRPPAIPPPELTDLYTIAQDGAGVQILRVANHTGTHVDTPCHVVEGAVRITDFRPEEMIFMRPAVIDLRLPDATVAMPADLERFAGTLRHADLALFRFGYGEVRRTDPKRFCTRCPGLGVESARWLRRTCPDLRALGLDVPSVAVIACLESTMPAHNELLSGVGRRFLIIEEMNLDQDLSRLIEVRINPWLVEGMDSGPCTIVGVLEDKE